MAVAALVVELVAALVVALVVEPVAAIVVELAAAFVAVDLAFPLASGSWLVLPAGE